MREDQERAMQGSESGEVRLWGSELTGRGKKALGSAIGGMKHALPDAHALLFYPIQQASRPHELRCQHAQRKQYRKNARTRRDDHHDPNHQKRESDQDLEKALGLMKCLNDQSISLFVQPVSRVLRPTSSTHSAYPLRNHDTGRLRTFTNSSARPFPSAHSPPNLCFMPIMGIFDGFYRIGNFALAYRFQMWELFTERR